MTQGPVSIFDTSALDYDDWFNRHNILFENECNALKKALPRSGIGVEIGVGTGRFAKALKIPVGVEPSVSMAQLAISRGVIVVKAKAEDLPFHHQSFDFAVMITTDCFLENISKAFYQAHDVIKKGGYFIVALIDKDSHLGKKYSGVKETNHWYKDAQFHSTQEITDLMEQTGFSSFEYWQTLINQKEEQEDAVPGFGKGGFIVIRAQKV